VDRRLVEQFRVSRNMRRFVDRMRLRIEDLDLTDPATTIEFERCCAAMKEILEKKKVVESDADTIIEQTLNAAADHQLEHLRRNRSVDDLARSRKDLRRLVRHFQHLAAAISQLPPNSIGRLNRIIAQQNWRDFDTETFFELAHAMQEALSGLSPACRADVARSAISKILRHSRDPAVARIARTAPPAIAELWELIPAQTRTSVEGRIRCWKAPRRGRVMAFLNHLVGLLEGNLPIVESGRPPAIEGRYLQKVAKLWRSFGLNVGLARDAAHSGRAESPFQRFARLGLSAVGDNSGISVRQISNLKSDWRRRSDR
jgi:hypothetical protein